MFINLMFDQNALNAPAAFRNAMVAAASYFDHLYHDQITVNIQVGWGEINGNPLSAGNLGQSSAGGDFFTYTQLRNALISHSATPDDATALANDLPVTDPTGGANMNLTTALERALGLHAASDNVIDGSVGFDSTASWTFNPDQRDVTGSYDFFGTALHELSEVMGRYSDANRASSTTMDLFRYGASGSRQLGTGSPAYFSIDGGVTNLGNWNTSGNGDYGDWASSVGPDAVLAFSGTGHANPWTQRDSRLMDVMGYNRVAKVDDYTGSNTAGIVLSDNSTGAVSLWTLNLGQFVSSTQIGGVDAGTQLVGSGDFNHDGTDDLLLRDTTGAVSVWTMKDGQFAGSTLLGGMGSDLQISGIGDFNGDGTSDVLYRDMTTGAVSVWTVVNNQVTGATELGGMGSDLQIAGVGDFNGDGTSDVLYRDMTTGSVSVWTVVNNQVTGATELGGMGANIKIVGVGDFTGSGTDDVLYQDTSTGAISYWTVANDVVTGTTQIGGLPSGWDVVGARNINGDGIANVLVHDNTSGQLGAFTVNGGQFNSYLNLGGIPSSYSVVA